MMTTATLEQPLASASGPPPAEWSDEELLLEYRKNGDQQLFAILVQRYEHELFSYLYAYLGNRQLAEDTFQMAFLHVHLKCDQFQSGRRVRPWLYKIATNRAIDNLRCIRRRSAFSLDTPRDPTDPDSRTWIEIISEDELGPVSRLINKEDCSCSREAMEQLPDHLRQVVQLIFFQGLKYREAAEVLSLPVGTVKSRMHTAIGKLHDILTLKA